VFDALLASSSAAFALRGWAGDLGGRILRSRILSQPKMNLWGFHLTSSIFKIYIMKNLERRSRIFTMLGSPQRIVLAAVSGGYAVGLHFFPAQMLQR
jgi:hypothetical protein